MSNIPPPPPEKQCESCQYYKERLALAEKIASEVMGQLQEILSTAAVLVPNEEIKQWQQDMLQLRIAFEKDRLFSNEYCDLLKRKVEAAKAKKE